VISTPIRFVSFAGRASELEHLLARRRDAAGGRGGAALIAGDPGIGKSRLVREFCDRLPRRTTRVVTAAFREYAQRPLAPLLSILTVLDPAAAERLSAAQSGSKREYSAALVDAFERTATTGTVVVVLEDIHWADRDALEVLAALVQRAAVLRLLFVATYRSGELHAAHPNFGLVGRMLREHCVSLVTLEALADKDVSDLLRGAVAGRAELPAGALDDIRRRSDGNTLFAEELLRYAVDHFEAGDALSMGSMPVTLQAAVADRLAQCSPAGRALLDAAALFGRRFEFDLVHSFAADTARDTQSAADAIGEVCDLGLIEPLAESPGAYRFRHALLRDAVYERIDVTQRRRLHREIAVLLGARTGVVADAESLAHHLWHGGEPDAAAPYCVAAAEEARALHAYHDAAGLYERAAEGYADEAAAARALASAAQVAGYADQLDRAAALYRRAYEAHVRAGRIDDVIVISVLAGGLTYASGRTSAALAMLEEARERWVPAASPPVRDRFHLRLGLMYAAVRRVDEAWACLEAIDEAALESQAALAAERLFLKSGLHAQRAEPELWHAAFERGFALFESSGAIPDNRRIALSNAAAQGAALGLDLPARAYQQRAVSLARTIRSNVEHECMLLGQLDVQAGNLDVAAQILRDAPVVERFATRVERAILTAWLAQLLRDDGSEADVDRALFAEAVTGGETSAIVRLACAFAPLEARAGRTKQADEMFARAARTIDSVFGMTFPIAMLAFHRPAAMETVRPLVARAADAPGDLVNGALLAFVDAAIAKQTGVTAAVAHARRAAAGFAGLGRAWLEALAFELAGDRAEALRCYRRDGALGAARSMERATFDAGAMPRSDGLLTPRERELVRLVAAGENNRRAAQRLSIGEKAVEKHLTSIYAKLGLSSRAQLAAYVAKPRTGGRQ
jgi:DNA-binding NarL/FixJ family response regulator